MAGERAGQCYEAADGESWALTRAEERAIVQDPTIAPHIYILREFHTVDVGKHNDDNYDGNAWRGDFEAHAENKHSSTSPALQWAANEVLEDGSYELYDTKARPTFWDQVLPDGVCVSASFVVVMGPTPSACGYWSNGADNWDPGATFQAEWNVCCAFVGAGGGPTWTSTRPEGMSHGGVMCGEGGVLATASICTTLEEQPGFSGGFSVRGVGIGVRTSIGYQVTFQS